MMGRMKEILAYAVVIMIAIFLRDNFIGEMWAGSGSALFANAMLGMVAVSYTHLTLPTKRIV